MKSRAQSTSLAQPPIKTDVLSIYPPCCLSYLVSLNISNNILSNVPPTLWLVYNICQVIRSMATIQPSLLSALTPPHSPLLLFPISPVKSFNALNDIAHISGPLIESPCFPMLFCLQVRVCAWTTNPPEYPQSTHIWHDSTVCHENKSSSPLTAT